MADDDILKIDPDLVSRFSLPQTQLPQVTIQDLSALLKGGPAIPQSVPQTGQQQQPSTQQQVSGRQPASVRYNNPGAMWPQDSATKFGSTSYGKLADGNLIAKFDDPVNGAAAQFDLLNSNKYLGKPIGDLIDKWSGHTGGAKQVAAYATHVAGAIGMSVNDPLTAEVLQGPKGIAFAKAQARMETGFDYPLTDDQWQEAQRRAFPQQVAQANTAQQPQQPYNRLW